MTSKDIRRLRKQLGLSQSEFAELVGVTANTVARWERGEMGLRTTTVKLLEILATSRRARKRKEA
jgi:DNA-binding transcriptional regulator YiaG